MRRGAQQSLDYDWRESPYAPVSKRAHLLVQEEAERPDPSNCDVLCEAARYFVCDRADMKQFYRDHEPMIEAMAEPEKERLRQVFREVLT